jgi:LysM repeat protein
VIIASLTPAPTPVTHIVQKGETLLGIALTYGISIADLQAANPNVQPQFLSIGAVLLIPNPSGTPVVGDVTLPTVTPFPVVLGDPACYPLPTGSTQCLADARNPNGMAVSNIAARITLADANGLPLADAIAYSPLDLIPPGGSAPLAVLFTPGPRGVAATSVTLLSASLAPSASATIILDLPQHTGTLLDGQWIVTGQVHSSSATSVSSAWLVVSLYDSADHLVGYRKQAIEGGLAAGATQNFSITAPSLTGGVDHYRLAAEGRP